jgi:hypothetical protein
MAAVRKGGVVVWMGLEAGLVGALPMCSLVPAYIVVARCSIATGATLVEFFGAEASDAVSGWLLACLIAQLRMLFWVNAGTKRLLCSW